MKTFIIYLISLTMFTFNINAKPVRNINPRLDTIYKNIPPYCKSVITSAYRTKEDADRVGGAKSSYHLNNQAIDISFTDLHKDVKYECEIIILKIAYVIQVSVIFYDNYVHLDVRESPVYLRPDMRK